MDENKDVKNEDTEENLEKKKENPFKDPAFYKGFFGSLILYLLAGYILGGEFLIIWSIPYLIVSSVIYSLINTTTPSFALGIILAGLTPFISMFLLMGGCLIFSI